jgi:hypothetical protein
MVKFTSIAAAAGVAIAANGSAHAADQPLQASALYAVCLAADLPGTPKKDQDEAAQLCNLYLLGVADAVFFMQAFYHGGNDTCIPGEWSFTGPEARKIFLEHLKNHPENLKFSAGIAAPGAFAVTYACKGSR